MKHDPVTPSTDRAPDLVRVQTGALVIIAFAVVLFLLVQARFMLITLAIAIIVFSLTSDFINFVSRAKIGRVGIPNWLASLVAVILIAAGMLTLTSILLSQINTVLFTTLSYAERAPSAIASLLSWLGPDSEDAIYNAMNAIEVSGYLRSAAGQAGNLMQGTVLVILFVTFLFAERIWFRSKLENFIGDTANAERVTKIITSIIHRVNYYILVKTLISAATGAMIFLLASFFNLDLAVAIGVMTFVLNFIPNVGSIIATLLIAIVAHVQLGDATTTGLIFGIAGIVQFVNGNIIDPSLMGRALRLSSFGIIISLAFWGAVWGIPGMFLSVPIMVMLMVVCSHVPALRPIAILLSRAGLPDTERSLDETAQRDLFKQR